MPMLLRRLSVLAAVFLLTLSAGGAQARELSRRDKAAVELLQQRMGKAEQAYRDAMLAADEDAAANATAAALAEMKAVVDACTAQHGCSVEGMLATYERLLQATPHFDDAVEDAGDAEEDGALIDAAAPEGAEVPEQANAAALLSEDGQRFVQMVQFNPAVQAGIRRWLTDMRPRLMDSYENYRYLQPLMAPAFKQHGLPEALLFGILAKESNGKVHAGSHAGAVGPLQFMPATGRRFGLGPDASGFDTRYDPQASAQAAAEYLTERMAELGNSIELSLAGYNGGEGRARRAYASSHGRSFWSSDVYNQFPAETRDYVPMVIAAAWLYLHPKEYGIRWPKVSVSEAAIKLEQPASIYELTICLGNWGSRDGYMRALRNLNPRWQAETSLPAGTVLKATRRIAWLYRFNCTRGKRLALAKQLTASQAQQAVVQVGEVRKLPAKPTSPKTYKVRSGDNLGEIAQRFGCSLQRLAKDNRIKSPKYAIHPGQRLKLRHCAD